MLGSGAHVKIGTVEYLLDEESEGHYEHVFEPRQLGSASEIIGSASPDTPGKVSFKENKILWTWDDWSGGEGNRVYYPDQPTKYSYAEGLNPRIRGQLTGRPNRDRQTVATEVIEERPLFGVGAGALWVVRGVKETSAGVSWQNQYSYTTDGTTWTDVNGSNTAVSGGFKHTAVTGDADYLYLAIYRDSVESRILLKVVPAGTETLLTSDGAPPFGGIALLGGYIYGWTGVGLYRMSTTSWTGNPVQVSPQTLNNPTGTQLGIDYWCDLITADNQLVMFYTTNGLSKVYEFHEDRGFSEIWTAPSGFSVKSICYQNGKVYALGHWGADASSDIQGFGAMYAIDLDTRQASFVSWFRKEVIGDLQMMEAAPSYGNQILISSAKTGRIFVYDADLNAVSMLDDLDTSRFGTTANKTDATSFTSNDHRIGSLITFGNRRYAAVYRPGSSGVGSHQILSWEDDEPGNRQASTTTGDYSMSWYSGEFDLGFPFEGKLLHGVHLGYNVDDSGTTSGLDDGQSIVVQISLDDAADVTLATITSASTPSTSIKGRTFVSDLTNNRKFYKGRLKVTLKGTRTSAVNYSPPVLKSVTLESSLDDYEEYWDLTVRTKDELTGERPTSRKLKATTLRGNLEDLAQNKNSVTLLDGARYPRTGDYTTHTVTVEKLSDSIERNAEGSARIRLRAVSQ